MLVFQRGKLRQRWDSKNAQANVLFWERLMYFNVFQWQMSQNWEWSVRKIKDLYFMENKWQVCNTDNIHKNSWTNICLCEWYEERRKGEKALQGKILWKLRIILQTCQFYTLNSVVRIARLNIKVPLKKGHCISIVHIFLSGNFCTTYYKQKV